MFLHAISFAVAVPGAPLKCAARKLKLSRTVTSPFLTRIAGLPPWRRGKRQANFYDSNDARRTARDLAAANAFRVSPGRYAMGYNKIKG
jgi:hypothetical protein